MIKPREIQFKAQKAKVRDQQIEKDYILSWILQGVAHHEHLIKIIAFKGGTLLKKVYFKDYRFSEDLDFTLLNDVISNKQIFEWFKEIFEYVKEEANIPLNIINDNEHKDGSINFYISYIGPLGGQDKKVKIDISKSEKLVFEVITKDVIISYTDQESHQLLCYPLEEVLVEKLRSVMQRMQPRDFYDIWYLSKIHKMNLDFYSNEFKIKCENKQIDPSEFREKLNKRLPEYKKRWGESMMAQIHDLPDFDQVERELMRNLKKYVFFNDQ
ncbi:MAG: nucleotidyl transferase AbiEii/AbiGii toxin family protein [Bacteroidia bacterium]|nr:nucleotidyl transferase AbiEii/AbiGii toxin family protein [Bacteroidia bacterium]